MFGLYCGFLSPFGVLNDSPFLSSLALLQMQEKRSKKKLNRGMKSEKQTARMCSLPNVPFYICPGSALVIELTPN